MRLLRGFLEKLKGGLPEVISVFEYLQMGLLLWMEH